MAAENLTPVTLELGGKSPAISAPTTRWKRRPSASWSASC
jgi:acyl-CoA reductase-like NAD-dependent aldehyde dehydrogenase